MSYYSISDFDCFDYDIHWTGNTLLTLTDVYSPRDCQAECYSNVDCIDFVYRTVDRYCFLKSSNTGTASDSYLISGPKTCSVYRGKRAFINDVTLCVPNTDPRSPSVTLKWVFYLYLHTECHKSTYSLPILAWHILLMVSFIYK